MKGKTAKLKTLFFAVFLAALLLCLSGCAREERTDPSAAGMPEAKRVIILQGNSAECGAEGVAVSGGEIVISEPGEYELSGTLKNGNIKVLTAKNAGDVALILNNAHISCDDGPAIEELEAGKLILLLPEGTENTVHSGGKKISAPDPDAVGAAIMAEDAMAVQGGGSLTVEGFLNNGVAGKKELSIHGGTLQISASNCGVSIAKHIEITDADIQIAAGNDGLRTHSAKVSGKGDVSISSSTLNITAGGDGIATEGNLFVAGGTLDITADGDPEVVSSKGIKAEGDTVIRDAELTVRSRDNALHGKGGLILFGGRVTLCSESGKGLRYSGTVQLDGDGTLKAEAAGNGIETDTDLVILSGELRVTAGGDGLRAGDSGTGQGTIHMDGGTVHVSAAGDALDAKILMSVNGGSLFAAGNSYRLKSFSAESGQAFLCAEPGETEAATIEIRTPEGQVLDRLDLAYPAGTVHFSSPALVRGESYELRSGAGAVSVVAG